MKKELNFDGLEIISTVFLGLLVLCWLGLDQNDSILIKSLVSILIVSIILLHFLNKTNHLLLHLFLIGICFRFHYLSYTGFEQLPFADALLDFFMANVLMDNGELTIITHELHDNRLAYYSSWPLSQTSVVIFSLIL